MQQTQLRHLNMQCKSLLLLLPSESLIPVLSMLDLLGWQYSVLRRGRRGGKKGRCRTLVSSLSLASLLRTNLLWWAQIKEAWQLPKPLDGLSIPPGYMNKIRAWSWSVDRRVVDKTWETGKVVPRSLTVMNTLRWCFGEMTLPRPQMMKSPLFRPSHGSTRSHNTIGRYRGRYRNCNNGSVEGRMKYQIQRYSRMN